MDEPTTEGVRHIERWQSAIKVMDQQQRALSRARTELENAVNCLGRWMVPDDIKVGETLCVWHADALIAVTKMDASGNGSFKIQVRRSGARRQLKG